MVSEEPMVADIIKREFHPQKLCPPIEAAKRIIERNNARPPKNRIVRFVKTFFGEGF